MLPDRPEAIPDAFRDAWMARDPAALARLFAEDADFVNVTGIRWRDRASIEAAHAYALSNFFAQTTLRLGRVDVRRLGDDVAVIHARMILDGQTDRDGQPLSRRTTQFVFVARRRAGGWETVAAQNTDVVPGAETHAMTQTGLQPRDYR